MTYICLKGGYADAKAIRKALRDPGIYPHVFLARPWEEWCWCMESKFARVHIPAPDADG